MGPELAGRYSELGQEAGAPCSLTGVRLALGLLKGRVGIRLGRYQVMRILRIVLSRYPESRVRARAVARRQRSAFRVLRGGA